MGMIAAPAPAKAQPSAALPPRRARRQTPPSPFLGPAPCPHWSIGELPVQPKLAIGAVDDPLEHEADRVADQVMRMPDPALAVSAAPPQVSRKCAACEEEDKQKLQMKSASSDQNSAAEAPAIVQEVLREPGEPLDAELRAFFEPRFGYDFSGVRVHADDRAGKSARSIGASAYTVGSNIAFASGGYAPATSSGRRLIAHELTHVVQQRSWPVLVQRDADSDDYKEGYQAGLSGKEAQPGPRDGDALTDYNEGYAKGHYEFGQKTMSGGTAGPVVTEAPTPAAPSPAAAAPTATAPAPASTVQPPAGGPAAVTNPYAGTVLEGSWKQGFDDGFAEPDANHPAPSPLPSDAATVYSEGVLAGKGAARPDTPTTSIAPPASPLSAPPDLTPQMSSPAKLVEAIRRGLQSKQLGQAAIDQLNALLDPEAVSIAILFWIASHYDGLGELLDAAAVIFEGLQFKAILEDLWDYATIAIGAETNADLDRAGQKFADAVVAAGVLKLLSIMEKFGAERKGAHEPERPAEAREGAGEHERPAEEQRKPTDEEEGGKAKEEGVPKELEGFCTIGSLKCSAFPKKVLDEVGPAPHQDRCAVPDGPWELRGKGDPTYESLRSVDMKTKRQPYIDRPDLWTPEFRAAYEKAGNKWPEAEGQAWELHHKKQLDFGGTNDLENLVPLERSIHTKLTSYWRAIKEAMAEPFGGTRSPRWKEIRAGGEDI